MQNFSPGASMLENLGLPLASKRLRGRRRLSYPTPSRPGARAEANLGRIPPSDEDAASTVIDLKRFQ